MEVTRIDIDSYNPKDKGICAEVSIVLDNCLAIHKVQIINGNKGLFVAMPNAGVGSLVNGKKRYEDIVHPIDKNLSEAIKSQVLNVYTNYTA